MLRISELYVADYTLQHCLKVLSRKASSVLALLLLSSSKNLVYVSSTPLTLSRPRPTPVVVT